MGQKISRAIQKIENVCNYLASAAIVAMMSLITIDTILRYFLNHPISGMQEVVASYLTVIMVYLSVSYCYRVGGHVRVDALRNVLPKLFMRVVDIIGGLASSAFFIIVIATNWSTMLSAYKRGSTPGGVVKTPIWPSYLVLIIGAALLTLRILLHTSNLIFGKTDELVSLDAPSITVTEAEEKTEKVSEKSEGKEDRP